MTVKRRNYGLNHAYFDVTGEGDGVVEVKLPGVTTITGLQPKPWMGPWTSRAVADYALWHWDELSDLPERERHDRLRNAANADRDRAAGKGTAVHRLGARLLAGEEVDPAEPLRGHAESYAAFLDAYTVAVIAAELVVVNRAVGYCGTLDLIGDLDEVRWRGEVIPPARWLLDVKTGKDIRSKDALQVCAYSRAESYLGTDGAEHPLAALGIERCAAVHVRADGWTLKPLDTGEVTWDYFKALAWLHYHDEIPDGWVGEAAEPPAPALAGAP
jgi:hypothetical protein